MTKTYMSEEEIEKLRMEILKHYSVRVFRNTPLDEALDQAKLAPGAIAEAKALGDALEWKEFDAEDRKTFPKEEGYYSCSPDPSMYSAELPIKGLHWSNHKPGRFSSRHWFDENITHYRGPIEGPALLQQGEDNG